MKAVAPGLLGGAFERSDLAIMQAVFDEACEARAANSQEDRVVIAKVIIVARQRGVRTRKKLLDCAMAAAL